MSPALHPRTWGFHLIALVLVGVAGWLGWWQVQAWQHARESEARDLTSAEPVALADVLGPDDPFPSAHVGQPVAVSGTWLPESTVYISGRVQDGTEGYWATTPLTVDGEESALYVVRGWATAPDDAPPPPAGEATVEVWMQPAEGTGAVDDDPSDDILPQVRMADLIQHVDQDLYGAYGVLRTPEDGLRAASLDQLPQVGGFTSIRNLLYALEWWVFGCFAAFIWWRWLRDEILAELPDDDDHEDDPDHATGEPDPTPGRVGDAG